ncbi:MAG: peptidoglycan DD-metalloendopeptidase family protein, partial [Flavobacteriales bacterium]|nr:peptidoglycan DD-metalloendopeptidase family protein [Flavobacteriales bacterium]
DLETGDTVVCAWDGVVRYAQANSGGYGNLVIVRHYNGLETYYAHLSKLLTFSGQKVTSGDVLGLGGNTGHSFGSHLHFEVRFYDNTINPEEVIDFKQKKLKDPNLFLHKTLFRPGVTPSNQWKTDSKGKKQYVEKKYYKVRSGDTLSRIAEKHRTNINRLCSLNGLRKTSILQIGQNIRVR